MDGLEYPRKTFCSMYGNMVVFSLRRGLPGTPARPTIPTDYTEMLSEEVANLFCTEILHPILNLFASLHNLGSPGFTRIISRPQKERTAIRVICFPGTALPLQYQQGCRLRPPVANIPLLSSHLFTIWKSRWTKIQLQD